MAEPTNLTTPVKNHAKSRDSQPREMRRTLLSEVAEFPSWRLWQRGEQWDDIDDQPGTSNLPWKFVDRVLYAVLPCKKEKLWT